MPPSGMILTIPRIMCKLKRNQRPHILNLNCCYFLSVWTIDLAHIMAYYKVPHMFMTLTLGVDKGYSSKVRLYTFLFQSKNIYAFYSNQNMWLGIPEYTLCFMQNMSILCTDIFHNIQFMPFHDKKLYLKNDNLHVWERVMEIRLYFTFCQSFYKSSFTHDETRVNKLFDSPESLGITLNKW